MLPSLSPSTPVAFYSLTRACSRLELDAWKFLPLFKGIFPEKVTAVCVIPPFFIVKQLFIRVNVHRKRGKSARNMKQFAKKFSAHVLTLIMFACRRSECSCGKRKLPKTWVDLQKLWRECSISPKCACARNEMCLDTYFSSFI